MRCKQPVKFTKADGTVAELCKSEEERRFLFKATGCTGGQQHFKCCTPHTLSDARPLLCAFCCYMTAAWHEQGRDLLPWDEVMFIALLREQRVTELWCHQVSRTGWRERFDFFNWKLDVLVQVDGAYHFSGGDNTAVFKRDCDCNEVAFKARWALVRVHVADLSQPQIVMAAIATAAHRRAVVFTASYSGLGLSHVPDLCDRVKHVCAPTCCAYGNVAFIPANTPTM